MSMTIGSGLYKIGAPGFAISATTIPANTSACESRVTPATVTGAVPPAIAIEFSSTGMPCLPAAIIISEAYSKSCKGDVIEVRILNMGRFFSSSLLPTTASASSTMNSRCSPL